MHPDAPQLGYERARKRRKVQAHNPPIEEIRARKDAILADIRSMREQDTVEQELIAREYGQMLADYAQHGQDYVLKQYHGGIALANLLDGLKSSSPEEKAYWSKLALEQMDKAEMRKFKRMLEEQPGAGGGLVVEIVKLEDMDG